MVRWNHKHEVIFHERLDTDVLAERRPFNQSELRFVLGERVQDGIRVSADHGDRNARILPKKSGNHIRQQILAERLRRAERQLAPGNSRHIGNYRTRFIRKRLEFLSVRQKRMSGWSQSDPPSGAIEQRHTKFILEDFDLLPHRRLRQQQFLRSTTKVQVSGNRPKDFKPEVLHCSLSLTKLAERCSRVFLPPRSTGSHNSTTSCASSVRDRST